MTRQSLLGCDVLQRIHRGKRSEVYKCRRLDDDAIVIVKLPAEWPPPTERIRTLYAERDALRRLTSCESVVRLMGLEADAGQCGLLLGPIEGVPLHEVVMVGNTPRPNCLALGLRLARSLADVHRCGVIHNDINPTNVLVDRTSLTPTLIDFASARLPDEDGPASISLLASRGPLSYISPEGTGRLCRTIDQRSDIYSLGVVLFELFTGRLPFSYDDPLEIVHAHLARSPPNPSDLIPGFPDSISRVLLRLLAKDPDDRYESATQLAADLESLLDESLGDSSTASSSKRRRPGIGFRVPDKIYGRENELQRIAAERQSTITGARLVRLTGPAGTGKSSLAKEFIRRSRSAAKYSGIGRFDAYGAGVPHDALAQALDSLTRQLLTENAKRLAAWGAELALILGGTDRVLCDICPRLTHILGTPMRVATTASNVRSQLVQAIIALLERLASAGDTVCLFFDDLQWAPTDSLKLISDIVIGCRSTSVLVMTAELPSASDKGSLDHWFATLGGAGIPLCAIELAPLGKADVQLLIEDTLSSSPAEAEPLAEIVMARTRGNPFFVRAFLESLHSDGMLDGGAAYDLEPIRRRGVTDNVVELLIARLDRLPVDTQKVLQVAACAGLEFEVAELNSVFNRSVIPDLVHASEAELVLFSEHNGSAPGHEDVAYFAHDRIRRTILSTLDEKARQHSHLLLGRYLVAQLNAVPPIGSVFPATRHLNAAAGLLESLEERVQLAELNLQAARLALTRAAFAETVAYAEIGIRVLPNPWADYYSLAVELHLIAAEAAFESAEHETLSKMASALLENVRSPIEAARVHWLQGRVHQAQSRTAQAIHTFCGALSDLGVTLPRQPTPEEVRDELEQTAELVAARGISTLANLPICVDSEARVAAEFLSKLIFFAYADANPILPVVICRLVRLSLKAGNSAESANAYVFYGLLEVMDQRHETAFKFGRLALEVAHKLGDTVILSQTYLYATYLLTHWKIPLRELSEPLREAYRYGRESGSPLNTACSVTTLCICRFWAGDELGHLMTDMEEFRRIVARFRQTRVLNWLEIVMQTVENLRSEQVEPTRLRGNIYDESVKLPEHVRENDKTAEFNLNVALSLVCYLFGDYSAALAHSENIRKTPALFSSSFWAVPVTFLNALCCLANCENAKGKERSRLLESSNACVQQLARWQTHNPRDIEHKLLLLEAETARLNHEDDRARGLYAQAEDLARRGMSPFDQALVAEIAGRFELERGERSQAQIHLRAAHRAYSRWGALAKARQLENKYPELLRGFLVEATSLWPFANEDKNFDIFDLASILSASRALSSEIKLDRLLERLVTLLIESAGAQAGCLLLKRDSRWVVEAACSVEFGIVSVLEALVPHALSSKGCEGPVEQIVNYVATTNETLLLQEESHWELFRVESASTSNEVGSILCFPLKRRGEILAIAYLENRLTRSAFTQNIVKVLEMLSAQAAVSLENARLYEQLEHRVESRTRELREKNEELAGTLNRLMEIQRQLVTQEKLAALGALAGGIAHEIKNPLNFIANFADNASSIADDLVAEIEPEFNRLWPKKQVEVLELVNELKTSVKKVREHSSRATLIVNEMALHARGGVERQDIDLNGVIARSLNMAMSASGQELGREVQVVTDYEPRLSLISGIAQDLSRVFVNLMNNALYAVREKQRIVRSEYVPAIHIATRNADTQVEVRIRDNGIGIPAESRHKVFVPFFTTKPSGQGTGLGLSLCHDIVVRGHSGSIRFDSVEREYTEFTLILPRSDS